jgi:hypothetical protein
MWTEFDFGIPHSLSAQAVLIKFYLYNLTGFETVYPITFSV